MLGEKAEKYIRESGEIEDLPDEEDEVEAENVMKDDDDGENEDEVIDRKEDYVPGFDLGRNKVQEVVCNRIVKASIELRLFLFVL
jgi:hypothetical protein